MWYQNFSALFSASRFSSLFSASPSCSFCLHLFGWVVLLINSHLFPFSSSLQLFWWLAPKSLWTLLHPLKTLRRKLVGPTPLLLGIHQGIPVSLRARLWEPRPLDLTNHNQPHLKQAQLWGPSLTTNGCIDGPLQPSWVRPPPLTPTSTSSASRKVIKLTFLSATNTMTRCLFILVLLENQGSNGKPFCFVYAMMFKKVKLCFPFTHFERELLTELDIAPAQLHPNSWAFVRAYQIICAHLGHPTSVDVFDVIPLAI